MKLYLSIFIFILLQVTFIFNNVVVDPDKDWQYDVFVYSSSNDSQNKTHILRVSDATLEDSGLYECYTTPDISASASVTVWSKSFCLKCNFFFLAKYIEGMLLIF